MDKTDVLDEVDRALDAYGYEDKINITKGSLMVEVKIENGKPSCRIKERIIEQI